MNPIEYERFVDANVRYRVEFATEKGQVVSFLVQLEVMREDNFRPVVRYDTAHGIAHRDRYKPGGTVVKHEPLPMSDFNQALTFALGDVTSNWEKWIDDWKGAADA